jgi:hypothetical protein
MDEYISNREPHGTAPWWIAPLVLIAFWACIAAIVWVAS